MTISELEINKELVASTGNISEETDAWLTSSESEGFVSKYNHEYGYRIYVAQDKEMFQQEIQELWNLGRGELAELMRLARRHRCKWLVLDADGPLVPNRPKFEW